MFLYLAYTDPHAGGWQGTAETGNPAPSDGAYSHTSWPDVEKDHASVISNFQDRDIGAILDSLERLNMLEDTLIMFASDNGAHNEGGHDVHFFQSSGVSLRSNCMRISRATHEMATSGT
jgi:arylsulfatase A